MEKFELSEFESAELDTLLEILENGSLGETIEGALSGLEKALAYAGFDPKKMQAWISTHRDASKEVIQMCYILLTRGNRIDKMIKKMSPEGVKIVNSLKQKYNLKSNGAGANVVTLSRVAACFPWIAPAICLKYPTIGVIPASQITELANTPYPPQMCNSTFFSCIPTGITGTEDLKNAAMLYQVTFTRLIGKEDVKQGSTGYIAGTIQPYLEAAMASPILSNEKRIAYCKDWGLIDGKNNASIVVKGAALVYKGKLSSSP